MPRPKRAVAAAAAAAAKKKKKVHDEFSDTESEEEEEDLENEEKGSEDEDDSDFEDPDLMEVPGGGRDLTTLQKVKGGPGKHANGKNSKNGTAGRSRPGTSGARAPGGASILRRPPGARPPPPQGAPQVVGLVDDDDDDDGLQVLKEVPGKGGGKGSAAIDSILKMKQRFAPGGLAGGPLGGAMVKTGRPGSSASPYVSASMMAARGPFSSISQTGDTKLLQQSIANGDLARLMGAGGGMGNPYSMRGASSLFGNPMLGLTGAAMGAGGSSTGYGLNRGMGAGLQKGQISSLWMTNAPERYRAPSAIDAQEDDEAAAEDEDDMGVIETYSNYMPKKLKIGKPHPDAVVETASMASVEPPDVWYKLKMPKETIDEGHLSALQLESITYSCQQHDQFLEDGNRAGFLIGDGAGVGKGRTIAGIILENYCQKRKRAIWVSVSNDLKYDAERDLGDIGAGHIDVHFLSKMKYAKINSSINGNVSKGVMYATYSALIGESQSTQNKYKSRLKQLLHWCGEDFDGVIVFDECHRAKNLCPSGAGKPTKTGQTVLELQQRLPKARIIYASATGASEPKHMAYMVRLGIWGPGSPFRNFNEFLGSVERRGVGAMEIVAMDMKLRGMYIARQLSFQGVAFKIDEVELEDDIRLAYNKSVDLWVDLLHKFQEAAELIDADKKMKKTMWGQFWSSHQRFFKYLCIASKVKHVVRTAAEVMKMGKCVVIGLQSTGEARTIEAVEREEELTDFVSTSKGVLQALVEKHFPAPDRDRIHRLLGIGKPKSLLDELGIGRKEAEELNGAGTSDGKRRRRQAAQKKKTKYADGGDDSEDSDFEESDEEEEEDDDFIDDEDASEDEEDSDEDSDENPFSDDDDDEDDPWAKKRGKKRKAEKEKEKAKKNKKSAGDSLAASDPFAHLFKKKESLTWPQKISEENFETNGSSSSMAGYKKSLMDAANDVIDSVNAQKKVKPPPPPKDNVDKACEMKRVLLERIEKLGAILPANTLDQLIDDLGGPENVAEMTGRKGRVVSDTNGEVRYESRSEMDVPLETLNLTEKERFMQGEKDVAIISEAASSGISLQADRRVKNKKRRVHMTLELPWSADRAIQQFGRTHRSNQVSAPEYILLISDLAGEQRFASIVAKRLESLGALTHGDRRAGEARDLSRFNIDNKYGRAALEGTFKAIMGYEVPIVKPPADYPGDFFKDIADGLVGVGLITQSEDCPGVLTLDKGYNDMSKFLNRILGLKVELQNILFKYFSDTLAAIISSAKRAGKYDQGILDVGLTEEDHVELVKTRTFQRKHATGTANIDLHTLQVERGLSWDAAVQKWEELVGADEGFYLSHQVRNGKKTAVLAVVIDKKTKSKGKKQEKVYVIYRPNTGQQVKNETASELKKKYKKVSKDEAMTHWKMQFDSSAVRCSHAYWRGNCKITTLGQKCEIGLRRKTYNVLAGSVLSVWTKVEEVLTHDGNKRGQDSKMQVVRLKLANDRRIVGTLIPGSAMSALTTALEHDPKVEVEETIH